MANVQSRISDTEENMEETMGRDNLAYRQPRSRPDDAIRPSFEFMALPEPAQKPDDGSRKPRFDGEGYVQTLDNTNGGPDSFYPDSATNSQSEV